MGEGARRDGEVDKEAPLFNVFKEFTCTVKKFSLQKIRIE